MTGYCFSGEHGHCDGCNCTCHKRSLFEQGRAARDDAMERVSENAPEAWNDHAIGLVYRIAKRMPQLATDDLWLNGLPPVREPRALGPVMAHAVDVGWLEELDETRLSRLPRQHRRPLRLYRSRIYEVS